MKILRIEQLIALQKMVQFGRHLAWCLCFSAFNALRKPSYTATSVILPGDARSILLYT